MDRWKILAVCPSVLVLVEGTHQITVSQASAWQSRVFRGSGSGRTRAGEVESLRPRATDPVARTTVSTELGHNSTQLLDRVYARVGRIRARSDVVEYRLPDGTLPGEDHFRRLLGPEKVERVRARSRRIVTGVRHKGGVSPSQRGRRESHNTVPHKV